MQLPFRLLSQTFDAITKRVCYDMALWCSSPAIILIPGLIALGPKEKHTPHGKTRKQTKPCSCSIDSLDRFSSDQQGVIEQWKKGWKKVWKRDCYVKEEGKEN